MDPAEEIVNEWLQSQGFFVMSSIVCKGNNEIDFIGIKPKTGEKVHVEVHVSSHPAQPLRAWGDQKYGKEKIDIRLKHYFDKKFIGTVKKIKQKSGISKEEEIVLADRVIEETIADKLGSKDYERWLVVGDIERDTPEQIVTEFKKLGVKVFFFREDVFTILLMQKAKRGRLVELLKYSTGTLKKKQAHT